MLPQVRGINKKVYSWNLSWFEYKKDIIGTEY